MASAPPLKTKYRSVAAHLEALGFKKLPMFQGRKNLYWVFEDTPECLAAKLHYEASMRSIMMMEPATPTHAEA